MPALGTLTFMSFQKPPIRKVLKFAGYVLGLGMLTALLYWLLPVALQSRLSADHVRWVFAASDTSPVASSSLSSPWALVLTAMKHLGLGYGTETFATSAALSAWISLTAIAVVARYAPWPAVILVALSPAVLWSAVIPNGAALSFLVLALMGLCGSPTVTREMHRVRWTFGALLEGLGCALTPFAWALAVARGLALRRTAVSRNERILRALLFIAGFSLPLALGVLLDPSQHAFSALPVFSMLREMIFEDSLGAGAVIVGVGGELTIGIFAGISFMVAAKFAPGWYLPAQKSVLRATWFMLVLPFLMALIMGHPKAWKLAHPGWNTILEDFAMNIERSVSKPTVAIVQSSTEESALRYADALLVKTSNVVPFTTWNIFDPSTVERVQRRESRFSPAEFLEQTEASKAQDLKLRFVDKLIATNIARGVQFWLEFPPDRSEGFETQFLAMGLRVSSTTGPTKFLTDREAALKPSYIRARPGIPEYLAGPSIETKVFARYAIYHLAVARIIEREKKTADWHKRARGEYYAALKKVEWLKDAHQKVCVEPKIEERKNPQVESAMATKPEPLDICQETKWYYGD